MRAVVLLVGLLAGCAAAAQTPRPAIFVCPILGDVSILHGDVATLRVAGRVLTLPRAMAASGVRYAEGKSEFWEKGGEAALTLDGKRIEGCRYDPLR